MSLSQFISTVDSDKKTVLDTILKGQSDKDPDDDKAGVSLKSVPVAKLSPTQNEVVIDKSLPFTLERPAVFKSYVESDGPFAVGKKGENDAIITLNGKFVIDGHHRWSALFCFNPKASIQAFDIEMPGMTPNQALIATQAAIIDKYGSRPDAKGGGVNLFAATEKDIKDAVNAAVTDELASEYRGMLSDSSFVSKMEAISGASIEGTDDLAEADGDSMSADSVREKITAFCWGNVQKLQKRKPIAGATPRELMPQADKVGPVSVSAGTPAALEKIATGDIDIKKPFATESRGRNEEFVMERWQRLAGLIK